MSNAKVVRGQVRQVVKEVLPEVLRQELADQIRKELSVQFHERFTNLAKHIQTTLEQIDERAKETQAYLIRNNK